MLAGGALDPRLSALFPAPMIDATLRSFCTDDYDLSSRTLDARLLLDPAVRLQRPTRDQILDAFGHPDEGTDRTLHYQFDFLHRADHTASRLQGRPVHFALDFGADSMLAGVYVQYENYAFWLDLEQLTGRLHVRR
jgi:hypothetical protein